MTPFGVPSIRRYRVIAGDCALRRVPAVTTLARPRPPGHAVVFLGLGVRVVDCGRADARHTVGAGTARHTAPGSVKPPATSVAAGGTERGSDRGADRHYHGGVRRPGRFRADGHLSSASRAVLGMDTPWQNAVLWPQSPRGPRTRGYYLKAFALLEGLVDQASGFGMKALWHHRSPREPRSHGRSERPRCPRILPCAGAVWLYHMGQVVETGVPVGSTGCRGPFRRTELAPLPQEPLQLLRWLDGEPRLRGSTHGCNAQRLSLGDSSNR